MSPRHWIARLIALAFLLPPGAAFARGLAVEVWTDRGDDAVYAPGDPIQIEARASDDAYLLVYEIDAQGYIHVFHPRPRSRGFVEGRRTIQIPDQAADFELTAQGPDGLGYVVAIASLEPFRDLPWYLRPYDPQAEEIGYVGRDEGDDGSDGEEQGVTAEGHIVGDPFVAMERIRRRILDDPDDSEGFASAYTSYYIGHQVRYPRYLCNDCHRPTHWAWWDGFDPYYTNCRVFDFRVNWSWAWGPRYWGGLVPYYVFVYRQDCPPHYRRSPPGTWFSSWDGWRRWRTMWGGSLTRFKSAPPPGYVPPAKWDDARRRRADVPSSPPGFIRGTRDVAVRVPRVEPIGRGGLAPSGERRRRDDAGAPNGDRRLRDGRRATPEPIVTPRERPRRDDSPPAERTPRVRDDRDAPRSERPRRSSGPRYERPLRDDRWSPEPRRTEPRYAPPAFEPRRVERPSMPRFERPAPEPRFEPRFEPRPVQREPRWEAPPPPRAQAPEPAPARPQAREERPAPRAERFNAGPPPVFEKRRGR